MKYFSPNYWFKLWMLIAPLLNDKTQCINAMSINNKNIKDWVSKNVTDLSLIENQEITLFNNQSYLDLPSWNNNLTKHAEYHKHRHEKHRNRIKRTLNGGNEIIGSWGIKVTCSFIPETFERLIKYYYGDKDLSNGQIFQKRMKNMYEGIDNIDNNSVSITATFPWTWKEIEIIGNGIFQNYWTFSKIEKVFTDSSRKERIEILMKVNSPIIVFQSAKIITEDTHYYSNIFFDNLKRDFPDWNKNIEINLGKINNNFDNEIKNVIKKKYSNLQLHCIKIDDKQFSYFLNPDNKTKSFGGFSAKILSSTNVGTDCYFYGPTKPTFTYVTQDKLNEISNIIANDSKVRQWFAHINDWNSTLPQAINNSKTFTLQALYNWKRQEKEIIKGYIRDWGYISTLIEQELKLDELNKNIQRIKVDFESIKNQVNELDNRLLNLESTSNWNCANIVGISAVAIAPIPVIGTISSAVLGITAGACAIAGI